MNPILDMFNKAVREHPDPCLHINGASTTFRKLEERSPAFAAYLQNV